MHNKYEIRLFASLWSVGSFCSVEGSVPDAVLRDSAGGTRYTITRSTTSVVMNIQKWQNEI